MKKSLFIISCLFFCLFLTSSQIIKTTLVVTVLDNLGTIQEGASVTLFENEQDYNNHNNAIGPKLTNAKGKVKFSKLNTVSYFMEVEHGKKNNFLGGEQTGKLESGKYNKVNVIISE